MKKLNRFKTAINYRLNIALIQLHKLFMHFLPYKLVYYSYRALLFKYYCLLADYRKKEQGNVAQYVMQIRGRLWCLNEFQIKKLIDKKILGDNMRNARNRNKYALYIA